MLNLVCVCVFTCTCPADRQVVIELGVVILIPLHKIFTDEIKLKSAFCILIQVVAAFTWVQ